MIAGNNIYFCAAADKSAPGQAEIGIGGDALAPVVALRRRSSRRLPGYGSGTYCPIAFAQCQFDAADASHHFRRRIGDECWIGGSDLVIASDSAAVGYPGISLLDGSQHAAGVRLCRTFHQ